ncbi:hypothetical protein M2325_000651 [Methanococcus voltae PS]|uniref:WYL domain-containing protein n=1 Tax=Methanococcus voltae PS TaxID=523842 RepID=A0ABT2EVI1_METVO|nr:hypothetical protein [Methanococcus voltae]MCS3921966.1 hypothetical protein [Methanococcus voltae PS]
MENKIIRAIGYKKRLNITYNNGGIRVIEPHAYGTDLNGVKKLRAYQNGGYSESGEPYGWKLFIVRNLNSVRPLDENFNVRSGYNFSGDKHIPNIIRKI